VRAVLDTNVVVSGIFFGGVPRTLLEAWADGRFDWFLSPSIFDEYLRTCDRLGTDHPTLEYQGLLTSIVGHGTLVPDAEAQESITADPDDDKFMICAQRVGAVVVSGDKHVLDASGWRGVTVLQPRAFLTQLRDEGFEAT
jgi:predicted nucleic acid-binding protein